ncbi:MAG: spiro-SPASM protein [Spirochaetaceae bacterium]|jgi:spiro-SPASM protein|nr:spiro-SPASM protein [Spirochaetaceae bacterium]
MNALAVLYGGSLAREVLETVFSGACALTRALERAALFPGVLKRVLLLGEDFEALPGAAGWTCPDGVEIRKIPVWTKDSLLNTLASLSEGFDLTYYAWADCPLLDPALAEAIQDRHLRYAAEYSYADGWPYGFSPEILAPGVAGILAKILGNTGEVVDRDAIFSVIQKDINAFDIETEISRRDLRSLRLCLAADSRRNLLLLTRLTGAGLDRAADAEGIITEKPELLRTLPSFYAIQVSGVCPQACELCPYPRLSLSPPEAAGKAGGGLFRGRPVTEGEDFLDPGLFALLLDRIAAFSGDAVVDLSLWGELSQHPQKLELIRLVLAKPELSLIIESSGIGWKTGELEALAADAARAGPRKNREPRAPLSWIVSLDAADPGLYREVRGPGYEEAVDAARTLTRLFPRDSYVQAVRVQGREDDIEGFYRSWKEAGANVIIQKYDDFCGFLPKRQASDLSPITRQPCWHLMRDLYIHIDGTVPQCREAAAAGGTVLGNAFEDSLEAIWAEGAALYREHCSRQYGGICTECDEYYTYNF